MPKFHGTFLSVLSILISIPSHAINIDPAEAAALKAASVPVAELEKYRIVYGPDYPAQDVIRRYNQGVSIGSFFNISTSQPPKIELNSDMYYPFRIPPEGGAVALKEKFPDAILPLATADFANNPEHATQTVLLARRKTNLNVSSDPKAAYMEAKNTVQELEKVNPRCGELAGSKLQVDSYSLLPKMCNGILQGKYDEKHLFDFYKMGVPDSLLNLHSQNRAKLTHFARGSEGISSSDAEQRALAARLLARNASPGMLSEEEIRKTFKALQERGDILESQFDFDDPTFKKMTEALKSSSFKDYPLVASIPAVLSFFRSTAENCISQNVMTPSSVNNIMASLKGEQFAEFLNQYDDVMNKTLIRPGDTIVHISHAPETVGGIRNQPYRESWETSHVATVAHKLNGNFHLYRAGDQKAADLILEAYNKIKETKGPLTVAVFGHGTAEPAKVCLIGRRGSPVEVEPLFQALVEKRKNDSTQVPITVLIHSCHSQAIGTQLLETWKEKAPQLEAPTVISTAGTAFDGTKVNSLPMIKESIGAFDSLAKRTQPTGVTGKDLLLTLGTQNLHLNEKNGPQAINSNELRIQMLCPSDLGCPQLMKY